MTVESKDVQALASEDQVQMPEHYVMFKVLITNGEIEPIAEIGMYIHTFYYFQ